MNCKEVFGIGVQYFDSRGRRTRLEREAGERDSVKKFGFDFGGVGELQRVFEQGSVLFQKIRYGCFEEIGFERSGIRGRGRLQKFRSEIRTVVGLEWRRQISDFQDTGLSVGLRELGAVFGWIAGVWQCSFETIYQIRNSGLQSEWRRICL